MPSSVNDRLADAAVSHAVDLAQYTNGAVRRIVALLNRADADLFARLTSELERMTPESFSVERLEQLLQSVRSINRDAYQRLDMSLTQELRDLTEYELTYQGGLLRSVLPAQVVAQVEIATVEVGQVYAAAMSRPWQGLLLREALSGLSDARAKLIRDQVRMGYIEQEPIAKIVQRLRGTRAKGYSDGLFDAPRRHVESVVRTAVSHTAGFARDRFHEGNGDIIKALSWHSTIDLRTSSPCFLRDGLRYTNETSPKPIGHKLKWGAGPGRLHWCCRSSSVPVTKSWKEMGINLPELAPSQRAGLDGQIAAATTYGDWLKRQSAARQDEVLGPVRGKLMRAGGLTVDEFADERGRWLDLATLRKRDAAAFQRAGV